MSGTALYFTLKTSFGGTTDTAAAIAACRTVFAEAEALRGSIWEIKRRRSRKMAENTELGVKEKEYPEEIFFEDDRYRNLLMQYRCAILELETKFHVLNTEFSLQHNRNPIESIKTRLKSPHSIVEKMQRKGWELTPENIEKNLSDVAGVRVICSFQEDIYSLARLLTQQDDIVVVDIKDYIAQPKANGYRSLHLILGIPIFLSDGKKHMRAEVQFRTIAMDFWASLEHKLRYKQDVRNADLIAHELKQCADTISQVDVRMQEIRKMIDRNQEEAAREAAESARGAAESAGGAAESGSREKAVWQDGRKNEVDSVE